MSEIIVFSLSIGCVGGGLYRTEVITDDREFEGVVLSKE
jgi:hypothetical protein